MLLSPAGTGKPSDMIASVAPSRPTGP
jgi:hypothetical protein